MPIRIDVGELGKAEPTPQGGIRVPAFLTRSGVFRYFKADGSPRMEWRPPEEVAKADSLATLRGATVTLRHPKTGDGLVSSVNFRQHVIGHVGDEVKMDGHRVAADMVVNDAEAIEQVKSGKTREVSSGYKCDVHMEAGVVPQGMPDAGQSYDAIQRNIKYNHTALVPMGRAGSEIRLRLDADDNAVDADEDRQDREPTMKTEIIDGVPYEVGTPAHAKAVQERDARLTKMRADHDEAIKNAADAKKELEAEREKRVAAEKRADAAEAKIKPEALAVLVKERTEVVGVAGKALAKSTKLDEMSNAEIRKAVVAKVKPHIKLDTKSEAEISALYEDAAHVVTRKRTDEEVDEDGVELAAHGRVLKAATIVHRGDADPEDEEEGGDDVDAWSKERGQQRTARRDSQPAPARHTLPLAMTRDGK